MKLSELTENDAVFVASKKEAKRITKLSEFKDVKPKSLIGFYICKYIEGGFYTLRRVDEDKNIIPARKFLKSTPSKKQLQAAISEVVEELAELKNSINNIETVLNQDNQVYLGYHSKIAVDFENVKEGLPELYSVKCENISQYKAVFSHISKQLGSEFDAKWHRNHNPKYFPYWIGFKNNGKEYYNYCLPSDGAPEITFEQFKKYVLKEEEKAPELEVGKWYNCKDDAWTCLWCVTEITEKSVVGYGFLNSDWIDTKVLYEPKHNIEWAKENFIPAADTEVFEALKAEAERKGYDKHRFLCLTNNNHNEQSGTFSYVNGNLFFGVNVCFHNGIWATIIDQPAAIDWSKAGAVGGAKR